MLIAEIAPYDNDKVISGEPGECCWCKVVLIKVFELIEIPGCSKKQYRELHVVYPMSVPVCDQGRKRVTCWDFLRRAKGAWRTDISQY